MGAVREIVCAECGERAEARDMNSLGSPWPCGNCGADLMRQIQERAIGKLVMGNKAHLTVVK